MPDNQIRTMSLINGRYEPLIWQYQPCSYLKVFLKGEQNMGNNGGPCSNHEALLYILQLKDVHCAITSRLTRCGRQLNSIMPWRALSNPGSMSQGARS